MSEWNGSIGRAKLCASMPIGARTSVRNPVKAGLLAGKNNTAISAMLKPGYLEMMHRYNESTDQGRATAGYCYLTFVARPL
jgi:hypothetical protein